MYLCFFNMKTLIFILTTVLFFSCNVDNLVPIGTNESRVQQETYSVSESLSPSDDGISVLTYNLAMLPVDGDFSSLERAEKIAEANFLDAYDVIVFQELIDEKPTQALLKALEAKFPYQTKVIGKDKSDWDKTFGAYYSYFSKLFLAGGVAIVSKYPFTEKKQHVFSNATGWDYAANKGFAHVKIDKKGVSYNVLGTHLNATHAKGLDYAGKRKLELREIKNYISNLPENEMVIIAGDFNILKGSTEYAEMLRILEVNEPRYIGIDYTFVQENQIAAYRYGNFVPEYLDYVFVSKNHLQPSNWYNLAFAPVFEELIFSSKGGFSFFDVSDHYPVGASIALSKEHVRKDGHYREYDNVTFMHLESKKRVSALGVNGEPVNMLVANQMNPRNFYTFNILAHNTRRYNDVKSGGLINIELSERRFKFWTPSESKTARPLVKNKFSRNLKLIILDENQNPITNDRFLENGDLVVFRDVDKNNQELFITRMKDTGTLRLFNSEITKESIFKVELNSNPQKKW